MKIYKFGFCYAESPGGKVINTTIRNSKLSGGTYLLKRNTIVGIGIEFEACELNDH